MSVVHAPASVLGGTDGQLRPTGAQGLFHADYRVLSEAVLRVDGREPVAVTHSLTGPGSAVFIGLLPWLGDLSPDPTVRLERRRRVSAAGMTENLRFTNASHEPVTLGLTVDLACDLAAIETVKSGGLTAPVPAYLDGGRPAWRQGGLAVTVTAPGARAAVSDTGAALVAWDVTIGPGSATEVDWKVAVSDPRSVLVEPAGPVEWERPELVADDRRLTRLLEQSLDDLESLRLAEAGSPGDAFLGAGVPWYLTLFGRDSLWAARMLLPLGTELAAGTLRTLARRQGQALDPRSGEAPGKILHELRRHEFHVALEGEELSLPPAYYGTVDATTLWISLLHDAWRWGLAEDAVEELLPTLEAALTWLDEYADPDRDGFVEYLDTSGLGLANQGWKDSGDAVCFADGRLAEAPIALAEVQAYAAQAATNAAALLDAFGRPAADKWRTYAVEMAKRFRSAFWVDGPRGAYPAMALDRAKRPVDALTSNIGHLLGTGMLTAEESTRVAELLASPELAGGYGLRTMSDRDGGYNPLSYHCGSVWAHDTAIAVSGLAAEGHADAAAVLTEGLLTAAEAVGYRLPELHGGDARTDLRHPTPYPASCQPQAWSAASAVAILHAASGLRPDVPAGQVTLRPLAGAPLGGFTVRGLRLAGRRVSVTVGRDGAASLSGTPSALAVLR
ncbi:glycogen debranching N-terminal domain-containing protein [Hamadaea sp.]|uniref:amylo-alpha-1,6-glucosidase n=1 Tax=Hamadaea sp. TaxID=2024425 RepID=UPI0025C60FFA|nr:glycogen debranching N-terminal domain-containing protein [Hamadaea sp.]